MTKNTILLIPVFLIICLFSNSLFFNPLFAQNTKGKITGVVIDKATGIPVEAADVRLTSADDSSFVTGTATDAGGNFLLEVLKPGRFVLNVRMLGYNSTSVNEIILNRRKNEINLDTIRIKSGSEIQTDVIEIEAQKSPIEFSADKKIFNVSEDITVTGGNALDVLKNVPSVQVDVDGNVSLRGSQNVKILVDGKPFGLEGSNRSAVLQQIPANSVESVELMTNPSAKYNPEGISGILNIILKKKTDAGYNGSFTANAGTNDKYSGSVNLNYKTDKINFSGSYNYNNQRNVMTGSSLRQNFFPGTAEFIEQINTGNMKRLSHLVKAGIDFEIDRKQSIGLNLNYSPRNSSRLGKNENKYTDSLGNINLNFLSNTNEDDAGKNFDASVNYNLKFKNPKNTLYGEVSYSRGTDDETSSTEEVYYIPVNNTPDKYKNIQNENENQTNIQLDYVNSPEKNIKIETGYKSIFRKNNDDINFLNYDYSTNSYINNVNISNNFIYSENIHALYAIFTDKIKDFSFSAGGRIEQTNTKGELVTGNKNFDKSYFGFFPSASISQKLSLSQELQLTYSRRINRPDSRNLNPFPDVSDPLNIRIGNPDLKPEYTNSFELSYINYFKFATVTPSVFYRKTDDEISRYRIVTDSNISITTFENLNSSKSYGLDFIVNSQILKWWNVNGNLSFYRSEVNASNISANLVNETDSWSARVSSAMNIPDLFDLQLTYFYSGKRISANGSVEPIQSLDAAVKKEFFNRRMSIGFRISDVFNTMKFRIRTGDDRYTQESERRRNSRTAFVTFTYNIGSTEKGKDRRGKKNERKDRDPGMDEDF